MFRSFLFLCLALIILAPVRSYSNSDLKRITCSTDDENASIRVFLNHTEGRIWGNSTIRLMFEMRGTPIIFRKKNMNLKMYRPLLTPPELSINSMTDELQYWISIHATQQEQTEDTILFKGTYRIIKYIDQAEQFSQGELPENINYDGEILCYES